MTASLSGIAGTGPGIELQAIIERSLSDFRFGEPIDFSVRKACPSKIASGAPIRILAIVADLEPGRAVARHLVRASDGKAPGGKRPATRFFRRSFTVIFFTVG
jgi:hypothetical protein